MDNTPSTDAVQGEIPRGESASCVDKVAKEGLSDMDKDTPMDVAQGEIPLGEVALCDENDAKGESSDMVVEEGAKPQSTPSTKETAAIQPATKPTDETKSPSYPSHPPFNWDMVRRRMENGRYVVDRIQSEEKERLHLLGPYYKTLGKRACKKILGGKKKSKSKLRVLHTKGVDWNLFRDDVLGMCEAAIARDSEESTGARGSLTHAANKLKEVR
jgi:hypothetical protein